MSSLYVYKSKFIKTVSNKYNIEKGKAQDIISIVITFNCNLINKISWNQGIIVKETSIILMK